MVDFTAIIAFLEVQWDWPRGWPGFLVDTIDLISEEGYDTREYPFSEDELPLLFKGGADFSLYS